MWSHDYCFGRLVHVGLTPGPCPLDDREVPAGAGEWERAERRWRDEIAEPFFVEMRRRADRYGLPVRCWVGHDPQSGDQDAIAFAELLRPDGDRYGFQALATAPGAALAQLEADWGETLARARAEHQYDFAWERRDAAMMRELDHIMALVAAGVPMHRIRPWASASDG